MYPRLFRLFLCFGAFLPMIGEAATLRVLPGPFASGKAFVSCNFDGIKQSCFLDTGSAMTLLADPKHFSLYPTLATFILKSASGIPEKVAAIRIRTATIDQVDFTNIKIGRVHSDQHIESSLGIDLIGRQPFRVNFRRGRSLRLNSEPPPSTCRGGLELNVQRLLSLPIALGTSKVRAIWDTGAGVTAVDEAFVKNHPEDFKPIKNFVKETDGAGHSFLVKAFRAKQIVIGARTFHNVPVVAVDLSLLRENASSEIHAVIGFNLIRKCDWFFDPGNKTWNID